MSRSSSSIFYSFWQISLFSVFLRGVASMSTFDKDVTLTLHQKALLDEFGDIVRNRLPHEYMKEEMYLIRWLRAKEYNIDQAVEALMRHIKWRRDENMDNVFNENWIDMERDYRYYLGHSRSKEGQPLIHITIGDFDIRKAVVNGNGGKLLRYIDRIFEDATSLVRKMAKQYKNVTRGWVIVDMSGFNLVEHGCLGCVPVILRMVTSFETHYPEYIDQLLVLNTPTVAQPLLNSMVALMTPSTKRALKFFGTNGNFNLQLLRNYFEDSEIPVKLGGEKLYRDLDYD